MDSNGMQRKRGGRLAKNKTAIENSPSQIENSAVAVSPTLEESDSTNCAPASECRRSSRKKIIKFDVRDLLNKNRKTHKIQIEARIDSNAPSTSKAAAGDGAAAPREDLLSKHKTFLEKSAIFRRYSISQEQKPPPPLPIPPLLSKSNESKDSGFCGTTSSQEFLSHALIKPKQPTSLIVAQIESNKPTSANITKRKGIQKSPVIKSVVSNSETFPIVQQKKRGRPAKVKPQTSEEKSTSNITPEKAKNWKEYKACLSQQSCCSNKEKHISNEREQTILTPPPQINQTQMLIRKQCSLNDSLLQSDMSRSDDDGSFTGFQISKDDISCDSPVLEKNNVERKTLGASSKTEPITDINLKSEIESIEKPITFKTILKKKYVIGEESDALLSDEFEAQQIEELSHKDSLNLHISHDSTFGADKLTNTVKKNKIEEDNQKLKTETWAAENVRNDTVIKESEIISPEEMKAAKEDIVSKVDNISSNVQKIENKKAEESKHDEQTAMEVKKLCKEYECSVTSTFHIDKAITESKSSKNSCVFSKIGEETEMQVKAEDNSTFELLKQPALSQSSLENKSFSRTSSSSESENASDRSIYSSEPFSTTSSSSTRSCQSGDMVQVSIKRISLPKSPSTSSQTSTSEELNNANIRKKKPPIAKRSKKTKKKLNDPLSTTNFSANKKECFQKFSIENKKLDLDVEKPVDFLETKVSAEENHPNTFTVCSKDIIVKAASAEMPLKVIEESANKKDTLKYDANSTSSKVMASIINDSPNEGFVAVLEKNTEKKSLRNRKGNSCNKKGAQTSLAKETAEKIQSLGEEVEEEESVNEKSISDEKQLVYKTGPVHDQGNKSENKQGKKTKKFPSPALQTKRNFGKSTSLTKEEINCTEEKSEILPVKEDTKLQEQDIKYDKATTCEKNKHFNELCKEDDVSTTDKTRSSTGESSIQQEVEHVFEKEGDLKRLSDTQNNFNSADESSEIISGNNIPATNITEVILKTTDKTEFSECKSTKQELDNETIPSQDMTKNEAIYAKSSKRAKEVTRQLEQEMCLTASVSSNKEEDKTNEEIIDLGPSGIEDRACGETKSPIRKSTAKLEKEIEGKINSSVPADTNNRNVLLLDSNFQDLSSSTVNDQKKKLCTEVMKTATTAEKKSEKIDLKISNATTIQNENVQCKGTYARNEHEMPASTSEIMDTTNSKNSQVKTELIDSDILSEEIIKNLKKDIKANEKKTSVVSTDLREESPPYSTTQQEMKKERDTSLIKSISPEIHRTEKSYKSDTSGKLLTKDSETDTSKSVLDTSKHKYTSRAVSSNIASLPKTKENRKEISIDSPKGTTSKKVLNNSAKESLTRSASCAESSMSVLTTKKVDELSQASKDPTLVKSHLFPETKNISSNRLEPSTHSSDANLNKILQGISESSGKEKVIDNRSASVTQQQIALADSTEKVSSASGPKVAKRRGRKPRFENLHAEDSGTDSSNGKITPIDEVIQRQLNPEIKVLLQESDVDTKYLQTSSRLEINKKEQHNVNDTEEAVSGIQEDSTTNLSTSQIKNVSIETNTLLDILRTVQSNTAAALKASKLPLNISKSDNDHADYNTAKENSEEPPKASQNFMNIQKEVIMSPIIDDAVFPSTSKKLHLSPERSNSNSPLTLKKIIPSPTRSNSSSPLTLKKVTRRYEKRSRRGEDSAHKTLEETFAEIAAQSSKAVLAAKEFEKKSPEELDATNTSIISQKEHITEHLEVFKEISSAAFETNVPDNTDNVVDEVVSKVTLDIEQQPTVQNEICYDTTENVSGMETAKSTPTRRGRKAKNRTPELVVITKEKEVISVESTEESKDESNNKEKELKPEVLNSSEDHDGTENDAKSKANVSLETTFNENLSDSKEKTFSSVAIYSIETESAVHTVIQSVEDIHETTPTKKFHNKRETEEDNSVVVVEDTCQEKSDKVRTPKQGIKKRDSSLNKNETKSVTKKEQKKDKNEEQEESLVFSKENTSIKNTATTPPISKRGRKPKAQQPDTPQSGSKKKPIKDSSPTTNDVAATNYEEVKLFEDECEFSVDKLSHEKLAKKTRQRKLKEAFEAALTDKEKNMATAITDALSLTKSLNLDLKIFNNSPPPERRASFSKANQSEIINPTCTTPIEVEDPDPLKDIEKFIADGVNLLKKDYKLDENSVDDVIQTTPIKQTEIVDDSPKDDVTLIFNTFETPADTPLNTPSVTPPPKSPSSLEPTTPDENCGVRRSHRIKLITKTPKPLVGRGLVRDRERFSIKDDVETKSHYTMDDHLTDLAEVEAKNAKFLKEMEERLSNFQVIKENEYLCERIISREARKMICDCFLTHEEEDRGELGCGEDCLNRLLMIECGSECNVKERCTNKRFQKLLCSPCRVFRTEKKGFGIMADIEILPGEFIMEYVGEVIDTEEFEKRRVMYSQEKNRHYYFMALRSDAIIDATIKGNISRFINHSCDPNAETQKWTVNGELRIGFFSRKSIMPGEEITFNYQYQRYGREAQRCYCESANCTGWIGQEPTSDEGEQIDDEDDETEDEEEENATTNLLAQDDEDDSDASVADPEEVQKRLEMAAAQAEVELAPLQLMQEKGKQAQPTEDDGKALQEFSKLENEEDSKSKFKKLLSKMAEKVAAKQKQSKREKKLQRKKKSKESSSELTSKLRFLEDPDIEDEVRFLKQCGLKNQSDTLRLSRLMVRAKIIQTRLNLLEILRKGDLPCRRLFLDYHGLRLLHGWMCEDAGNMQIRLSLLQTLQTLPIANKTVLTDSKVMQVVRTWSGPSSSLSPNEDSSSSNSNSQDVPVQGPTTTAFELNSEIAELQKLALKLNTAWEGLPEIFRIPKKERIEQMKEHEREADRQYAANAEIQEYTTATDRYRRDRFGRGLNTPNNSASALNRFTKPNSGNSHKTACTTPENFKNLSKTQRRELFAAKVARDEAEKRLAEERREFETKCRFFGLDPKKTRTQDMPFCVNPATGQWFSIERKPITTPPSYAHVQVPVKPKSTDPNDYQLPAVCSTLPPQWKYAITPQGKIYFYHIKHRLPQWEPPSSAQLQHCELEAKEAESESENTSTAGEDSSDDDDDVLIGMDATQLKAYINRKVEKRRLKRYQRLVDERSISPRREEDRIYNQIEVRKYKENKEKIRKRKEDIRRKRAEAHRQTSLNMCTLGSITDAINSNASKLSTESDEELGALPIQDYLLSSDEEIDIKAEVNSPLIDKIVEGDKIVDELDALTTKRQLKRPLPPHRDLSEISTPSSASTSTLIATTIAAKQEYKKRKLEKKEKRKPREQDVKYRKNKEKFRCEIAGIIVHHLKPYLKETCTVGRIQSNEDFNHLARKLTHFVMIKELKYCESVGQTLVVTESVKSKSREFIKKYMAKYGDVYVKPTNDPDFKNIPFTL